MIGCQLGHGIQLTGHDVLIGETDAQDTSFDSVEVGEAVYIRPVNETVKIIKARLELLGRPQGAFVISRAIGANFASSIGDVLSGFELSLPYTYIPQRLPTVKRREREGW